MKVYIHSAIGAEEEGRQLLQDLRDRGIWCIMQTNYDEDRLRACDFLVLVLSSAADINDKTTQAVWRFFDGEIRWKRKEKDALCAVIGEEPRESDLPLRLKKYGYYLFGEGESLAEYIKSLEERDEIDRKKKEAVPPVKQIKYNPPEETVKQIEFSVRAPAVPSFDGSKSRQGDKDEGDVCKHDHVFDEPDTVPQKTAKKKFHAGAFVFAVLFILFVVIITCANIAGSCAATLTRGAFSPVFDTGTHSTNALQYVAEYGILSRIG